MKRILCLIGLALVGIAMMPGAASAQLVCYRWNIFPEERFRLNVKLDSALSLDLEERTFHHANQTARSIFQDTRQTPPVTAGASGLQQQ